MRTRYWLTSVTAPTALMGIWLAFLPLPAAAATYAAGTKDSTGDICTCPVLTGNCVCKIVQ